MPLDVDPEVASALREGRPVVAMETTFIAHGLPWPRNLDTTHAMREAIRAAGAEPAIIGIVKGRVRVGMGPEEVARFARDRSAEKASRRDLARLIATNRDGATTVSGTMACAHLAGIRVFATGGIGGVHRDFAHTLDVSADLTELGRTPLAVVCSGAKSVLDLERTLEYLETEGVPVLGYGTSHFPAFYLRETALPVDMRVDSPQEAASVIRANELLGGGGILLANPIPTGAALDPEKLESWTRHAQSDAAAEGVRGKDVTPFLLDRIFALSGGEGLEANSALLIDNARVGAEVAVALGRL